jgi:two-component system nitrogen regulation sensor histidine kinase NtrY
MTQVLINLLQNSINALQEDHRPNQPKYIKIKLYQETEMLYVTIEDSGPGFPADVLDKLLEPYYTTRERGTGLGLAIVSKIVSDHNGQIELQNSPDLSGACVKLSFARQEITKKGMII